MVQFSFTSTHYRLGTMIKLFLKQYFFKTCYFIVIINNYIRTISK